MTKHTPVPFQAIYSTSKAKNQKGRKTFCTNFKGILSLPSLRCLADVWSAPSQGPGRQGLQAALQRVQRLGGVPAAGDLRALDTFEPETEITIPLIAMI